MPILVKEYIFGTHSHKQGKSLLRTYNRTLRKEGPQSPYLPGWTNSESGLRF